MDGRSLKLTFLRLIDLEIDMRPDCLNHALTKAEDSSSGGVGMASRRLEDDKCHPPASTIACSELSKGTPAYGRYLHTNRGGMTRLLRGIRNNRSATDTQHHRTGDNHDIKHPLCYGRRHFHSLHH